MIRVTDGSREGFFCFVIFLLNEFSKCEHKKEQIVVDNFSYSYSNFEDYFYQPYNDINIIYDGVKELNIENMVTYEKLVILDILQRYDLRKYINYLINKYLKVSNKINNKVTEIVNKNFNNKKILGVHIRQTDHHVHGELLKIDQYIKSIDKQINSYDILYVMSDNIESIIKLKDLYKDKLFYLPDIIRSDKENGIPPHRMKGLDKYILGENILIETLLLSKCDHTILTNSNIANFIICNNINQKFEFIDLKINNLK